MYNASNILYIHFSSICVRANLKPGGFQIRTKPGREFGLLDQTSIQTANMIELSYNVTMRNSWTLHLAEPSTLHPQNMLHQEVSSVCTLTNDQSIWTVWKHESHLKARTLRQMELPSWIQSLSNLAIPTKQPKTAYEFMKSHEIHEFSACVMGVSLYYTLSLCLRTLTARFRDWGHCQTEKCGNSTSTFKLMMLAVICNLPLVVSSQRKVSLLFMIYHIVT